MSGGSVNLLQSTFLLAVTVPRPESAKTLLMQPRITSSLLISSEIFGAGFFFVVFFVALLAAFFVAIVFSLITERRPGPLSLPVSCKLPRRVRDLRPLLPAH